MASRQLVSESSEKIDLSIIIVNHNTTRLLEQCLQSIFETVEDLRLEIFVIDNASSDGSVEMVRAEFPQVRLLVNSIGLGFARAANRGLVEARGDYLLTAHPDIKFLPGAMQAMLGFLTTHPEVGVVGGNLIYPDGNYNRCAIKRSSVRQELVEFSYTIFRSPIKAIPWLRSWFDKERDSYYWDHQAVSQSDLIWNACMMFKREVYERMGGFYEEFFIWFADTDWCYRVRNAGWQACYLPQAEFIHYEKQSTGYLNSDLVRYKIRPTLVQSALNKDRYILLKRHYSPFFLWFKKALDFATVWLTVGKLVLLRVFAPRRYRSTLDLTR